MIRPIQPHNVETLIESKLGLSLTNKDVVDRAVKMVDDGVATINEISRSIEYALSARPDAPWRVFAAWVRKVDTLRRQEMQARSSAQDDQPDDDPEVIVCYRDKEGRNMAIPTTALTYREAESLSEELSGKRLTYREVLAEINAFRKRRYTGAF